MVMLSSETSSSVLKLRQVSRASEMHFAARSMIDESCWVPVKILHHYVYNCMCVI